MRHKAISSWGYTPNILKMQRLRLQVANEHHYLNEKYIINGDWICAFLIGYDNAFSDLELSVFGSIFLYSKYVSRFTDKIHYGNMTHTNMHIVNQRNLPRWKVTRYIKPKSINFETNKKMSKNDANCIWLLLTISLWFLFLRHSFSGLSIKQPTREQ